MKRVLLLLVAVLDGLEDLLWLVFGGEDGVAYNRRWRDVDRTIRRGGRKRVRS